MGRRQVLAAMTLFGAAAMASRPAGSTQTLKVGAALPDPPFEFTRDGAPVSGPEKLQRFTTPWVVLARPRSLGRS